MKRKAPSPSSQATQNASQHQTSLIPPSPVSSTKGHQKHMEDYFIASKRSTRREDKKLNVSALTDDYEKKREIREELRVNMFSRHFIMNFPPRTSITLLQSCLQSCDKKILALYSLEIDSQNLCMLHFLYSS